MANLSSKTGTVTTPVQAQISLANNATVSVQDMSAYEAQEVMGFVYIDATADLRAYFKVQVVKNGAGTYEIAAADVAGDQSGTGASAVAPVSFSMSGSILQATLPNISGFNAATSYLRYQLSAPYLGGNYPLSVSASQVLGNVSGTVAATGYLGQMIGTETALSNAKIYKTETTTIAATNTTLLTLSLTPGVWMISTRIVQALGGAGRNLTVVAKDEAGSNIVSYLVSNVNSTASSDYATVSPVFPILVSANTTITIVGSVTDSSNNPVTGRVGGNTGFAIRIA